jgi:hypothetical protein
MDLERPSTGTKYGANAYGDKVRMLRDLNDASRTALSSRTEGSLKEFPPSFL